MELKIYLDNEVVTFDKDPQCKTIGQKLYKDVTFATAEIEYFNFKTYDIVEPCTNLYKRRDELVKVRNIFSDISDAIIDGLAPVYLVEMTTSGG